MPLGLKSWGNPGGGIWCPSVLGIRYLFPSTKQGPSWALLAQSLEEEEAAIPIHLHPGVEVGAGPRAGAVLGLGGKAERLQAWLGQPPPFTLGNFKQGARVHPSYVTFLHPWSMVLPQCL